MDKLGATLANGGRSEEAVDASGEDDDEKVVVVEAVQDLICHHKSHNHNHRSDSLLPLE